MATHASSPPAVGLPIFTPSPPPRPIPGAPTLIDCEVCAGVGIMTARDASGLYDPEWVVPCLRCGGAGVFLDNVADLPDIADWVEDIIAAPAPRSPLSPDVEAWQRLAQLARLQARCCLRSAVGASTPADVEAQAALGRAYLRAAFRCDAAAFDLARAGR